MADTIYALSSGLPPCAISVIRVSGPDATKAACQLAGSLPEPRMACLRALKGKTGEHLDDALVLWFPGPKSATGEDVLELHCHGGRAVTRAVMNAIGEVRGCRAAEPGEFTRRAFANGRMDLAQAEGLADLLAAETEIQRRQAMAIAGGALSRRVDEWRIEILALSASVESVLDFSEEDDVEEVPHTFYEECQALHDEIVLALQAPRAETLREGLSVVIAGPPNSGKSTLFNALVDDRAAIVSEIPGTTRDVIERTIALDGIPFKFTDTAGLRDQTHDRIEAEGITMARGRLETADIVLWLGEEGAGPKSALEIDARIDRPDWSPKSNPLVRLSANTGEGLKTLRRRLLERATFLLPNPGMTALNDRQRKHLTVLTAFLSEVRRERDLLVLGELLRKARLELDRLVGRTSTEDMLDSLFKKFCIGK